MTTTTPALHRAASWHRPLMFLVAAMAVLTLITAVGTAVDDRVLTGAPIWLKPLKFSVSFVVYGLTLAWMLSLLPRRSPVAEWAAVVIVGAAVVEMAVIAGQALRGETSHYNATTPFNALLFDIMGAAIMVLFLFHVVLAFAVLRQRLPDRVAGAGIRLGLGVFVIGMLAAVPMVTINMPGNPDITGAHSVGTPDGGPGLPVVGWSTVGGDLRVGHFVGMHGLQALPLLAWALGRFAGRLTERTRVGLLVVAGGAYVMLTVLLTWQALRGQPLLSPDAGTLAAFGALAAATTGAVLALLARDRRSGFALAS